MKRVNGWIVLLIAGVGCHGETIDALEADAASSDSALDEVAVDSGSVDSAPVDVGPVDSGPCKAGSYRSSGKCLPCPLNSYSSTDEASTCTSCPSGTYARVGSTACVTSPSCSIGGDGMTNCGAGTETCCASLRVTGIDTASFQRSFDGATAGYTDPSFKARVSDFRLDKYEVSVGRFRQFVNAVVTGWTPPAASGKHAHLHGGSGLANSGSTGYEAGWDVAWNTHLPSDKASWDGTSHLTCGPNFATWTSKIGGNEKKPINCVDWYQAYAFCIWDQGFLPSEAEWNYASAGGTEHRSFPWGSTPAPGSNAELAAHGCWFNGTGSGSCTGVTNLATVGAIPAGNGRWGQSDLAGNVFEWALDWYSNPYAETSCDDCANLATRTARVTRGGAYQTAPSALHTGYRATNVGPDVHSLLVGLRCAHAP